MCNVLCKTLCFLATICSVVALCSCVTFSLHPLYEGLDMIELPGAAGKWQTEPEENGRQRTIVIEKEKSANLYKVTVSNSSASPSGADVFDVVFVKIDGRVFYDAQQSSTVTNGQEWFPEFFVRPHMIGRIRLEGNTLQHDLLDDDWLKARLYSGKIKLSYEITDEKWNDLVLTAPSEDLQGFAATYANDDQAFGMPDTYHRVK